ncbi:hypothetical protein AXD71_14895, partial [Listeria monocytogenes]|uniref:hypothetical protein n=1 Tax=Listeria monocytogenes TaxID=1639 RepID=UPI000963A190
DFDEHDLLHFENESLISDSNTDDFEDCVEVHSEPIPVISEEQGSDQVEGEQRNLVEASQNRGNSSNKESSQEPGSLSELNSDE